MTQATRARAHPRITLNSDGEKHPRENSLAIFTFIAGLVAFTIGWIVVRHAIAFWIALVTMVVGFYAQMISATREQRIIIVTGLIAAFIGGALALGHGGPF
jgi:hypothetical protein